MQHLTAHGSPMSATPAADGRSSSHQTLEAAATR